MALAFPSEPLKVKHLAVLAALLYLCIGLFVLDDFGAGYDEEAQRIDNGLVNYDFVLGHDKEALRIGNERYHGPTFELVLIALEKALPLSDIRSIYLMRHAVNFLVFFLSIVVMYLLAKGVFGQRKWALFAAAMYALSPRFFAEAFYNSKDIIFLACTTFSLYTFYRFSQRPGFSWAVVHAVVTGIMIDVRILGLIIPVATVGHMVFYHFANPHRQLTFLRLAALLAVYVVAQALAVIAFWPILWDGPWFHLQAAFDEMSHYHWSGNIRYMGQILTESSLPWHYLPVWMGITIPLVFLILLVVGVMGVVIRSISINKERHFALRFDLLFLALLVGPLVLIIARHSVVYDGWRHVYFLYAPLVLVATRGAMLLWQKCLPCIADSYRKWALTGLFAACFAAPIIDMVRFHPYQYVYFNAVGTTFFAPLDAYFEMDYWGLAYREGLEHLLELSGTDTVAVMPDDFPGFANRFLLTRHQRNRLRYEGAITRPGIYYLTNFRGMLGRDTPFASELVYEVQTPVGPILSVYRNSDQWTVIDTLHDETLHFDNDEQFTWFEGAPSGTRVNKVGGANEFGFSIRYVVDSLFLANRPFIHMSSLFNSEVFAPQVRHVVSADRKGQNVLWQSRPLAHAMDRTNAWIPWHWTHEVDRANLQVGDEIIVYLWSMDADHVYQDNVRATFVTMR